MMSPDIVLSERDFGLGIPEDWQTALIRRLAHTKWLFLGAGIQDPNLNRYLRAASNEDVKKHSRFVALALQGQHWSSTTAELQQALDTAERGRLEDMNLTALQADYFMQIPQLLHEVTLARRGMEEYFSGGSRIRYSPRLNLWWDRITSTRLKNSTPADHRETQVILNEMMTLFRSDLETTLRTRPHERDSERLKVELWVRNPKLRRLELWGSSENISTVRDHIPARPLEVNSRFASVKAFCYGSIQRVDVPSHDSRWQYFVGMPVVLYDDEDWYQLPVATLSIASTRDEGHSALRHETRALLKLRGELLVTTRELLTPPRSEIGGISPE